MADVTFIGLYDTLDKALSKRVSPEIDFYGVCGINLLPLKQEKIRQKTNNDVGVSIESYTAYLVNLRTNDEVDVTDNFFVENLFQDEKGFNQVTWNLTNIPDVFGSELCYLKINQTVGQDYFSNVFTVDSSQEDKTAVFFYKQKEADLMLSIGLKMWFYESLKQVEIKNYYELSTKNTVTLSTKSKKYERWKTDIIGRDLAIFISDMFESKFLYLDGFRVNLFEAFEIPELTSKSETKRYSVKLNINKNDTFDPLNEVIAVPVVPEIVLNSVETNGFIATFSFVLSNFSPALLTFEYSSDQVTWISENKGVTSPQSVSFNKIGTWFFRVSHQLAVSNVLQVVIDSTLIANNDTAKVSKGAFVNIPVLFNDVLTGNVQITSFTQGSNGTVSLNPNNTLKYQHDGSLSTFDTFSYTIENGVSSATGSVGVTILQSAGTSTSFSTSPNGSSSPTTACGFNLSATRYHTGASSLPTLDDFVFNDAALTMPLVGSNQFFTIANGRTIQVDNNGKVIDLHICVPDGTNIA